MADKTAAAVSKSIRDIIDAVQPRVESMTPSQASDYVVRLATLLYDMADVVGESKSQYYQKWHMFRKLSATAKDSEIEAKATPEYATAETLERRFDALVEIIQALKKKIVILEAQTKMKY